MVFEKVVVVDCKGHLLGRLASVIAKELLKGQRVVAVGCEQINVSGKFIRNKFKYLSFLRKRTNTNPKKGPIHFRAPSKILWRTVRGMLPHKTARGQIALDKLKVFDGCPPPYDRQKKVVIPEALRALRLKPMRKYTVLGELASEVGWKYGEVVSTLEEKRKVKAAAWYERKQTLNKLRQTAVNNVLPQLEKEQQVLADAGYTLQ
eukprot:TRINITY_DN7937_c0_g1_i1.p1 TRINITY_DN7937_c0_g1~~TRINITY_DN7937_c0_g1_i1.p1  ORF type:complete len:205 (+),score=52.96 TRINITY_DN7937_c0_g1_i1:50-664(+)